MHHFLGIYPDDGTDAETLLRNADIAILNAKDNGHNRHWSLEPPPLSDSYLS